MHVPARVVFAFVGASQVSGYHLHNRHANMHQDAKRDVISASFTTNGVVVPITFENNYLVAATAAPTSAVDSDGSGATASATTSYAVAESTPTSTGGTAGKDDWCDGEKIMQEGHNLGCGTEQGSNLKFLDNADEASDYTYTVKFKAPSNQQLYLRCWNTWYFNGTGVEETGWTHAQIRTIAPGSGIVLAMENLSSGACGAYTESEFPVANNKAVGDVSGSPAVTWAEFTASGTQFSAFDVSTIEAEHGTVAPVGMKITVEGNDDKVSSYCSVTKVYDHAWDFVNRFRKDLAITGFQGNSIVANVDLYWTSS